VKAIIVAHEILKDIKTLSKNSLEGIKLIFFSASENSMKAGALALAIIYIRRKKITFYHHQQGAL
jgi:hypothetical protein